MCVVKLGSSCATVYLSLQRVCTDQLIGLGGLLNFEQSVYSQDIQDQLPKSCGIATCKFTIHAALGQLSS